MTVKMGTQNLPFLLSAILLLYFQLIVHTTTATSNFTFEGDSDIDGEESQTRTTKVSKEFWFTYGDDDIFGPRHWRRRKTADPRGKLKKLYEGTHCQTNWLSPININTKRVHMPHAQLDELKNSETERLLRDETSVLPETLIIVVAVANIHKRTWELGHPMKYYGIEIRANTVGLIHLMDNFHPHGTTNSFTSYDFHFLSIFYCNTRKALPHRTMHQINGKRFPLELEFVFLRKVPSKESTPILDLSETGLQNESDDDERNANSKSTRNMLYDKEFEAVIVSVLGEIDKDDMSNIYFQPVVDAARKFAGKNPEMETSSSERNQVIAGQWSPTWLLPDSSDYYYYDKGSFPVPPCWSVARFYVLRETIKISQAQLHVLTHIQTDREKLSKNTLSCTHSISLINQQTLVSSSEAQKVYLNLIEYEMTGEPDHKPRTEYEQKTLAQKKKRREIFRKRLFGGSVVDLADAENIASSADTSDARSITYKTIGALPGKIQIKILTLSVATFKLLV